MRNIVFVIMAGGRGERLWPLVRTHTPKVCLSLNGSGTLLEMTMRRLRAVNATARQVIVTTQEQVRAIRRTLPATLKPEILTEPEPKNTAACLALAALILNRRNPHTVIVALPADHWITDESAFHRAVRRAIDAAATHQTMVTVGIRPTHPHVGLGYLCAGVEVTPHRFPRTVRLSRCVEKPSHALARRLLTRRGVYWNSGMFIATASVFLEHFATWLPAHLQRLAPLVERASNRRKMPSSRALERAYRMLPSISFDHGVMAHVRSGLIVEGRFGWSDVGSLDVWAQHAAPARTLHVGSHGVEVISTDHHLIATLGVRDLLITHTEEATLICPRSRVQEVRRVVQRLRQRREWASYR